MTPQTFKQIDRKNREISYVLPYNQNYQQNISTDQLNVILTRSNQKFELGTIKSSVIIDIFNIQCIKQYDTISNIMFLNIFNKSDTYKYELLPKVVNIQKNEDEDKFIYIIHQLNEQYTYSYIQLNKHVDKCQFDIKLQYLDSQSNKEEVTDDQYQYPILVKYKKQVNTRIASQTRISFINKVLVTYFILMTTYMIGLIINERKQERNEQKIN